MQVHPEQTVPAEAHHCGDRFPTESDILPNPSPCQRPVYHLSPEGTCFSDNVSPPPYDTCLNYNAPSAHGYADPTESQFEPPDYHSLHLNITGLVVSAQPPMIIAQPAPAVMSPPTYLGWSMFNCLCCFWPLGLAAIIYSVKVGSARTREEAKRYSLTARNLNIATTTIAPILVIVVVGAVLGSRAATGSAGSSSGYTTSYYVKANYYSYGYSNYYTYLMYYTYYNTYSYLVYSSYYSTYYGYTSYNSYTATGYQSVAASKYTSDYYYQYAQGAYYYYSG